MWEYSFWSFNARKTASAKSFGIGQGDRSNLVETNSIVKKSLPGSFCLAEDVDNKSLSSDKCLMVKEDSIITNEASDTVKNVQLKLGLASLLPWQKPEYFQLYEL